VTWLKKLKDNENHKFRTPFRFNSGGRKAL
jgi:hypothetical protein